MAFNINNIMKTVAKVVDVADKVADGIHKYGGMASDYAKMAPEDWKLPVKATWLQNITGTISKVLGTTDKILSPFQKDLAKIPFVGKFIDKGLDFIGDTALPFLQKPVTQSIPFLGKIMPTVDTVVQIAGKVGNILDGVKQHLPAQQSNARNLVAHSHAQALNAG